MIIPHLFRIEDESGFPSNRFVVKISITDYTPVSTGWMDDDRLPEGKVWQPSVDVTLDAYYFPSEVEAVDFIGEWWTFRRENLKALKNKFEGADPWISYIDAEIKRMGS